MNNKSKRDLNKLENSERRTPLNTIPLDISNANKLYLPKLKFIKREIPEYLVSQEFEIQSDFIEFLTDEKKPRGFRLPKCEGVSLVELVRMSSFLPHDLPYLIFNSSKIEYIKLEGIPQLALEIYGFKDTPNKSAFIAKTKDSVLYVYDWKLNLLHKLDVAQYSSGHTHLRNIDLSSDLSYFLFTNENKAYLLNSSFEIVSSWEMPNKEGYERLTYKGEDNFARLKY